jgi:hypothetical protein
VRAADVDLFEMRHATVSSGDGDVLELDVHVIFGCAMSAVRVVWRVGRATFYELSTVHLAGGDLEGDDVTLAR